MIIIKAQVIIVVRLRVTCARDPVPPSGTGPGIAREQGATCLTSCGLLPDGAQGPLGHLRFSFFFEIRASFCLEDWKLFSNASSWMVNYNIGHLLVKRFPDKTEPKRHDTQHFE